MGCRHNWAPTITQSPDGQSTVRHQCLTCGHTTAKPHNTVKTTFRLATAGIVFGLVLSLFLTNVPTWLTILWGLSLLAFVITGPIMLWRRLKTNPTTQDHNEDASS